AASRASVWHEVRIMVDVDGSIGEGGGQVVRSAVALSMITGRPCRVRNVRAGREKPGLLRQHLTALRAAATVSGGKLEGGERGARDIAFETGKIRPGAFRFAVGSAGSTMLVLQTILPALLIADGRSEISLEGGTHNPFAPPFDFVDRVLVPVVNRMGPTVRT